MTQRKPWCSTGTETWEVHVLASAARTPLLGGGPMAMLVVPWEHHNRVVGDTGPYAIRDHAPIMASQNRREKAQIMGWDYSRTPPVALRCPSARAVDSPTRRLRPWTASLPNRCLGRRGFHTRNRCQR